MTSPVLEFSVPIPVETPLGRGWAIFAEIDNFTQFWTVILDDTCAFVTFQQTQIRAQRSYTHARCISDEEMREMIKRRTG